MKNKDSDTLSWQFEELVKTLLTLSSPAEKQREICGISCPGDDMANDFDSYYTLCKSQYIDRGYLTSLQIEALDKLDKFLEDRSGQQYEEFWCNSTSLDQHKDWETIRELAKNCLDVLGKTDFDIVVEHTFEHDVSNDGKEVTIQHTKTQSVPKNCL